MRHRLLHPQMLRWWASVSVVFPLTAVAPVIPDVCLCPQRVDLRISHLVAAQDCYKKAKNEFFAAQTEDQHKLLKYQACVESPTSHF